MMEQLSENNPDQAETSGATPPVLPGKLLREARERLGLSVSDVANQIKFAPRQIEALEADEFQQLPESAFLRGFIRSYAKILQLDAQELLDALPRAKAVTIDLVPASVNVPFPDARSLLRQNVTLLAAAGLLAVIAGAFALWNYLSPPGPSSALKVETPLSMPAEVPVTPSEPIPDNDVAVLPGEVEKPKTRTASVKKESSDTVAKAEVSVAGTQARVPKSALKPTEPTSVLPSKSEVKPVTKPEDKVKPEVKPATASSSQAEKPATEPGALSPITQLRLEFGEESWTEIKDGEGNILTSKVNPPGSELVVYGRAPFTMLIGHGLSVRLYHQGKQVDLAPYINKFSEVAHVTLK